MSRDPIGERGGVNLYGFLDNYGISSLDILGLSPVDKFFATQTDRQNSINSARRQIAQTMSSSIQTYWKYDLAHSTGYVGALADLSLLSGYTPFELSDSQMNEVAQGGSAAFHPKFNELYLNSLGSTEGDIIHELVHAFNANSYSGTSQGADEGMAYGFEWISTSIDLLYKSFEKPLKRNSLPSGWGNCNELRISMDNQWKRFWNRTKEEELPNVTTYGMFGYPSNRKLGPGDLRNIKNRLGVEIRCKALADRLNSYNVSRGCCIKFSCDAQSTSSKEITVGFSLNSIFQ